MFGFVTFDYPETVKLILAKGNPHFVCDARVLVKPYKEKGKIPDKHRYISICTLQIDFKILEFFLSKTLVVDTVCRKQQQQMERGEFTGCGSPTGLDSRDPFDLHLGKRCVHQNNCLYMELCKIP